MPPLGLRLFRTTARCSSRSKVAQRAKPAAESRRSARLFGPAATAGSPCDPAGSVGATRAFASISIAPDTASDLPPLPPPRWLADLRARVGKCIIFGCSPALVSEAAVVLRALATEWRQLTAGSEGYLTGKRRGLDGQKVVWGEMDSFAHVNNVVYARYAESSRVDWVNHFALHVDPARSEQWRGLMQVQTIGLIMKSLTTEFKFPMTYPDTISVYHKLRVPPEADPSETSLLLDCIVLSHSHKRIAARLYEDVSFYDYRIAAKTQMPEFMRDVLTDTWRQQQQEVVQARVRIWELAAVVRRLEKRTWDRVDAVEDVGSAAA